MLTMLEEVVLLAVDERSGKLRSSRRFSTESALVGAVFFDLSLAGKIDTDTENIQIIDQTPTGNPILDRVLAHFGQRPDLKSVRDWLHEIFYMRDDLQMEALAALTDRGILRHEKTKLLWIIDVERFPLVDNKPQQYVKLRLAQTILSDDIPDTRDVMLVSIADACGLLEYVLSDTQISARSDRISLLVGMETISREVRSAIADLELVALRSMAPMP